MSLFVVMHWRDVLADWSAPSHGVVPPGVPTVLAEFFAAGGRRISSQNSFRDPLDDAGWQVFYIEAQGICRWAYRGDEHDPPIHIREDGPYRPVGCRLDAFLSAATVLEAVMGAPAWRAAEGPEEETDALLALPRLDLPHLGWPEEPVTYYGAGDVLAYAQAGFVFIGAHDDAALHGIDARIKHDPRWLLNGRTEQA
jgi:hypothetical protein